MPDWGSGYVTDTAYVHDFCRVQTPAMLSFAALAKDVATPGGHGEALAYCDLGCGQGFTANVVAAANPGTRVFAADFNPTHIAGARSLAQTAGLKNIEFHEADFAELLNDPSVPEFDIICMHGVYSWISAENRQTIVAFIRRRLTRQRTRSDDADGVRLDARRVHRGRCRRIHRDAACVRIAVRHGATAGGTTSGVVEKGTRAGSHAGRQAQGHRRSFLSDVSLCFGSIGAAEEASGVLSGA